MTTLLTSYEPLTIESAIELSKHLQLFSKEGDLTCEEIGDGNLNLVFRIQHARTGNSIIIKQALPYAKVVGTSMPLTLDRARIETEALNRAYELAPKFSPKVHHHDPILAITVMEDLSHLTIVRKGFIAREVYPNLGQDVGTFLARTLFYNSDYGMNQQEKKLLNGKFINPELCKITEDLVFTDPFFDVESNNILKELKPFVADTIWSDIRLKQEVGLLKRSFLTKAETLLHGDLHTGSIFAGKNETKIIDPEFAFYGPIGFDIGAFIANLFMNSLSQEAHCPNEKERKLYQNYLSNVIKDTWITFEREFTSLWDEHQQDAFMKVEGFKERVLGDIFRDTLGFAGCKIIRRMIGLSNVEDVESIDDLMQRIEVKKKALTLGKNLIMKRNNISSIDELLKVVTQ